ncbi:MAG: glycosyltransferase family 4 protein [Mesonia sp.]|uniref:glycosyltransferase family 4 protein n=1 Tax=Mesonia sp. TaxID=1960830 RepID=UPI003241C8E1
MKISILHPFTPKAAGVVEQRVRTYHSQPHLKALQLYAQDHGGEVAMEYFTHQRKSYQLAEGGVAYRFYPVSWRLNGDHRKWKKQASKACLKAYQESTPDVTIINMSGHSSPFSHQLAKILRAQGRPYIPMLGGQHYSDTAENRDYYQHAHHILVHTESQKKSMESMPLFSGKDIRVFPLGVDTQVFKSGNLSLSAAPKLLYVGRILELKRIHLAIESVAALHQVGFSEASLQIIGPVASEAYAEELVQLVKTNALENHVHFLGHKEHEELPPYFQEAHLFLLPSTHESFGMVMIEAMACGTPVVAMENSGGPADVITSGVNGLLSTPENYSACIVDYFKNPSQQKAIEKQALAKAVEEYGIQATYRVLQSSIEDALK